MYVCLCVCVFVRVVVDSLVLATRQLREELKALPTGRTEYSHMSDMSSYRCVPSVVWCGVVWCLSLIHI